MTTKTIHLRLTPALALEVERNRQLANLRLIQKNRARLDRWHEETVRKLAAIEKEIQSCTTSST